MTLDTALAPLVGGGLIGLSAGLLMLSLGRVAGISGIYGGLFSRSDGGRQAWQMAFLGGLLGASLVFQSVRPEVFGSSPASLPVVALAGLLVGGGVRTGGGCTSGHGVCGISRLSRRSLVATATFIATGMLTASALQMTLGGAP